MSLPQISVLVPVWNDERRIGLCLDALLAQSLAPEQFEIIVIDNGSTDGTAAVVSEYAGVILLREDKPGSYAARNTGLAHARGIYVAFTDSDCIPDREWLERGLAAVKDREDVGVAAGRVAFREPEGDYSRACLNYERHLSMRQDENAANGYAITANWFCRKDLLLSMGGFNSELRSGGDYALSGTISRSGRRTIYVADAVVHHPARAQVHEITGKIRRVVGGRWASETGRFKALRRAKVETRSFITRVRKILRASGLTFVERIELLGLLMRIWMISLKELARLQLGGVPTRS
ncbi:glycosyl transferase [Agaricicola taiwanensis]|uniref:Glycosyl transferase n=1 Tax=Agaricicola taiwanensis TaxID=591372 RepID=A0A8J2YJX3_9RHOB|nr:glycosyltransferase family A protein [Agaricicola taiwanensis]GGE48906.1 glycosyl transferase [Agaricicola taiwanensis]